MLSIIDFETTGLVKEGSNDFLVQPGITQVGLVVLNDALEEVDHLDQFINPDIAAAAWSADAIRVTGIGPEQVKDAPSFLGAFSLLASKARGALYWSGYNTKFDKDVLWYQLLRYGLERNYPWPERELDVMKIVSDKLGTVPGKKHARWKLTDAYQKIFKRDFDDAHTGIADCRACADIIREVGREYVSA